MNCQKKIAEFFATICYVGKIRHAPGTFGSLTAFPLYYIIMYFICNGKVIFPLGQIDPDAPQIFNIFFILLGLTLLIFIIGTYFTSIYIKDNPNQDPKEVVIDELAGQFLTITLCTLSTIMVYNSSIAKDLGKDITDIIFLFILPFILFRIFDIIKPWPIDFIDNKIKGAMGVMLDDIAAAIFASVIHYVLSFVILDIFPIT